MNTIKQLKTKLKITRDVEDKNGKLEEHYYLWVIYPEETHCICRRKTKEDVLNVVELVKDIIPELNLTYEEIVSNDMVFKVKAENRLSLGLENDYTIRRDYAIFYGDRCVGVVFNDYQAVLDKIKAISEDNKPEKIVNNELVIEIELN